MYCEESHSVVFGEEAFSFWCRGFFVLVTCHPPRVSHIFPGRLKLSVAFHFYATYESDRTASFNDVCSKRLCRLFNRMLPSPQDILIDPFEISTFPFTQIILKFTCFNFGKPRLFYI